jgi:hypothetical protein
VGAALSCGEFFVWCSKSGLMLEEGDRDLRGGKLSSTIIVIITTTLLHDTEQQHHCR